MSKGNQSAQRPEVRHLAEASQEGADAIAELRKQVAELRSFIRTMAVLVLPPQARGVCETDGCGRIADRTVTLVHPHGLSRQIRLCDHCNKPEGYTQVGLVAMDGNLRETVRLANSILDSGN